MWLRDTFDVVSNTPERPDFRDWGVVALERVIPGHYTQGFPRIVMPAIQQQEPTIGAVGYICNDGSFELLDRGAVVRTLYKSPARLLIIVSSL